MQLVRVAGACRSTSWREFQRPAEPEQRRSGQVTNLTPIAALAQSKLRAEPRRGALPVHLYQQPVEVGKQSDLFWRQVITGFCADGVVGSGERVGQDGDPGVIVFYQTDLAGNGQAERL